MEEDGMIRLKSGQLVMRCGCGEPGGQFIVTIEEGLKKGEKMLCHEACLKPA